MRKLKRCFNTLFVLICFICLGFYSCTTEPVKTDLLLPVDFSNVPDNMVLTHFHTDKIEIKIQADPQLLEIINKKNIHYSVDLYTDLEFDPAGASDSIEPGTYLLPVEKKRIPLDPVIKILSINPSYLSVQLERKIKRTVNVSVPYIGKPAKGYIALEAATDPVSVELTGSAPKISSIRELKTKPIDITNASEDFKKKVPLDLDDPSIVSSSDPIIIVTVPIQQQLVSKTIENIPILVWNNTSTIEIEPSRITIQIKGPFESLNNREITGQIYSFVDLKGLSPGVYVRHAYINIPVGLIMTEADPQVFTIKIK